ncbi:MAG: hypothetical protein GF317_22780 [Candidatus Lokiarchaeota archaeon]|nr:hypothetical protein [Candidatus Lokiarchaeota archaeon]
MSKFKNIITINSIDISEKMRIYKMEILPRKEQFNGIDVKLVACIVISENQEDGWVIRIFWSKEILGIINNDEEEAIKKLIPEWKKDRAGPTVKEFVSESIGDPYNPFRII